MQKQRDSSALSEQTHTLFEKFAPIFSTQLDFRRQIINRIVYI